MASEMVDYLVAERVSLKVSERAHSRAAMMAAYAVVALGSTSVSCLV
jgi:hypothetical protein